MCCACNEQVVKGSLSLPFKYINSNMKPMALLILFDEIRTVAQLCKRRGGSAPHSCQPCQNLTTNDTFPVFLSAPRTQIVADCSFCQGKMPVHGQGHHANSSVTVRPLVDVELKIPRYLYGISQEQLIPPRNVDCDSPSNCAAVVYLRLISLG